MHSISSSNIDGSDARIVLYSSRSVLSSYLDCNIWWRYCFKFWLYQELKIQFTLCSRYLKHPFSITVFEDLMYWSEWESHRIYQVKLPPMYQLFFGQTEPYIPFFSSG